eukprot:7583344-Lingulodinium_polyedra.AAC.1
MAVAPLPQLRPPRPLRLVKGRPPGLPKAAVAERAAQAAAPSAVADRQVVGVAASFAAAAAVAFAAVARAA